MIESNDWAQVLSHVPSRSTVALPHHVGPGADLPLPVAQSRERSHKEEWTTDAADTAEALKDGDALMTQEK